MLDSRQNVRLKVELTKGKREEHHDVTCALVSVRLATTSVDELPAKDKPRNAVRAPLHVNAHGYGR